MPHRIHRLDANHKKIVSGLRKRFMSVISLANVGDGCPDLLVGYCGRTFLFELKSSSKFVLTPSQDKLHFVWRGSKIHIVTRLEEITEIVYKEVNHQLHN
jgi:hypothetical protein